MRRLLTVVGLGLAMGLGLLAYAPPSQAIQVVPHIQRDGLGINLRTGELTRNRTGFRPEIHGFRFANDFANNFIPEFDWRTNGLCGGMVFAALDYFNNQSVPVPNQDYLPADGTTLRDYIYARQVHSTTDQNLDQWIEYGFNPHGQRNSEFYRWGLEGRLFELKREIDAGRPVPIGLPACGGTCVGGDHQVLAIGYDIGSYNGDPSSPSARDVRILVYDPNFPGEMMRLAPLWEGRQWGYRPEENRGVNRRWQSWSISTYSVRAPPVITRAAHELLLIIGTGGDDLRGTNDNLNVHVLTRTGRTLTFENVNRGHPWINNSVQEIALPLPADLLPSDVRGVRLRTLSGGGPFGDNWNLESLEVRGYVNGERTDFFNAENTPLARFTGDEPEHEFLFCPGCR